MKFQIKIILATTLTLILILFYLNTMVINYMEYIKEDILSQSFDKNKQMKRDFVEKRFQEYVLNVLLWEFLLVLALMLILYKVIDRMMRQEREYKDFLELLLITISHKFGNFLAAQKGNIEILKIRHEPKALHRLETSYNYLQEDLQSIVDSINRFKELSHIREKINIRELIEKSLAMSPYELNLKSKFRDVYVYGNRQIVENIIFPIIDNAFKYSEGNIQIRLTEKYLAIRNRIVSTDRGSGVGLKIAETLAKKQGFKLHFHGKGDYFISVLKFK